jgi:3',5'-cyclic AMP phosphodiesterase CpdA
MVGSSRKDIERLCWATDLHFNFADPRPFCAQIAGLAPDALVVTGDISEAPTLTEHLRGLERHLAPLGIPIYIVLGNHDFYHGSIVHGRKAAFALCRKSRWLRYLPGEGIVRLNGSTALVGHEGWADGRLGDYGRSDVLLNDYIRIKELAGLDHRTQRLARLHALGDEAASALEPRLVSALREYENVIVATHVPPWKEACWHQGQLSDDMYLPHFSCKAMGDMILKAAGKFPKKRILVLCGHTHSAGRARISSNIIAWTGGAEYGQPKPEGIILAQTLKPTWAIR